MKVSAATSVASGDGRGGAEGRRGWWKPSEVIGRSAAVEDFQVADAPTKKPKPRKRDGGGTAEYVPDFRDTA